MSYSEIFEKVRILSRIVLKFRKVARNVFFPWYRSGARLIWRGADCGVASAGVDFARGLEG